MIPKRVIMDLKNRAAEHRQRREDLDVILSEVMKLPYGQLKKVLTEPVLAILQKYGHGEV